MRSVQLQINSDRRNGGETLELYLRRMSCIALTPVNSGSGFALPSVRVAIDRSVYLHHQVDRQRPRHGSSDTVGKLLPVLHAENERVDIEPQRIRCARLAGLV